MTWINCLRELALDAVGHQVRSMTGSESSLEDFQSPPGDTGLFGPDSIAWRVHAHFSAMMVGGLSSLMVQSLYPRALAAVWDHSNFRVDLKKRLGRTAYFVAATTYGSESLALQAIHRVNSIHASIRGVDRAGKPYVANDPDLIRWVHLVEVDSFLTAYQYLSPQPLAPAHCDQYIAEMTQVGHRLGATSLPLDWSSTRWELLTFLPHLDFDDRAQEIVRVVQSYPADLVDKPFMTLVLASAFDVMPSWALSLIGRQPRGWAQRLATRLALQVASQPVQWTLDHRGVAATARQRVEGAGHESVR